MKHWKRFSALVLALALLAALAVPASAASVSSFDDITDPTVGVNADVLRFMGVVSGKGGNLFAPNDTLTRAEFCALLVGIMGRTSQVAGQLNRTIFTDVTSTHWARGYVNLAATITIGEGTHLITGVGGGQFAPDRTITFGEAVTILVRVLGYTDDQVGHIWPGDYVAKAAEIGLSAGVSATANSVINRAQAAQLFVNLLTCKKSGSGSCYYEDLGEATPDAILLSINATADDGTRGAVRTDYGTYLPASTSGLPASFVGQKGVQVVRDGLIVAFIPDSGRAVTVTLASAAGRTSFQATNGTTYTISPTAKVYTGTSQNATYADVFELLTSGTQVTLYLTNGKVDGLYYAGINSSIGSDAVIVSGSASDAMFYQLTGGASNYRILKDRQEITIKDIKDYDVVTYDPVTNTLLVSDLRITVGYTAADNLRAPTAIEVNGISGTLEDGKFEVLTCGVDSVAQFRAGDTMTILLTADGRVAQALAPTSKVRSTAVGLVEDGTVKIPLPAGGYLTCSGSRLSGELYGQLVTVSSSRSGLSAARLANKSAPGDFDLESMTLGEYTVAAGAALYERVGANGAAVPLDLTGLDLTTIPASRVSTYSLNSSDMVDVLVVDNVTGNAFVYGILDEDTITQPSSGGLSATNRTVQALNPNGNSEKCMTGLSFTEGVYGGVAVGVWDELNGINRAAAIITLNEVKNVSASDFFTANGVTYVNASGRVYPVAGNAVCRNGSTGDNWFESLDAALKVGDSFSLYVDPIGNMVRVVVAQTR